MAEAYLNQLARRGGLDFRAESAGTKIGKELNPTVVEVMAEDGVNVGAQYPKLLTEEMVQRADKVISMGCGVDASACPSKFILSEDWELDDPAGEDISQVRQIRDQVKSRVVELLKQV